MRIYFYLLPSIFYLLLFSGCGEFHAPTSEQVIRNPFGAQAPFLRGSSKQQVLASWGEPDEIIPLGVDELGNPREEWIYTGRLPAVPVDYGYVSQTKHLIFEGENLVRWRSEEPESPSADTP